MPWGNSGFFIFRNIYKLIIHFILMVKEVQIKVSQPKQETPKLEVQLESVNIKKVGVLSLANLFAIFNLFFGLITGISITLFSLLFPGQLTFEGHLFFIVGPFSMLIFPIVFGILGWFSGIVGGLFYNLSAKITNGIVLYS